MTKAQAAISSPSPQPIAILLELSRHARHVRNPAELLFLAVNDSHSLAPYRQAAVWLDNSVKTLSGVVQIEANAPYVHWLARLFKTLEEIKMQPRSIAANDTPGELAAEWDEWLPHYGLWVPFSAEGEVGGVLFARDIPWRENEIALLSEWIDVWSHAYRALVQPKQTFPLRLRVWGSKSVATQEKRPLWRKPSLWWALLGAGIAFFPVRLTVLAPGELAPANPAVIRAPLDGVLETFFVKPNQMVKSGDPLIGFDRASLASKLDVASQGLLTTEAEYRQSAQQAVSDTKPKALLATLQGKMEERRAEVDFLRGYLERARVTAPQDGVVLFDDPSEWIGRPVSTGERIMRIAAPNDVEVEAWLPVGDAIPLASDAPVKLYLSASPLSPISATLRYAAHDAIQRPDGSYAYRVRARLDSETAHRVGLKGTVKLSGESVPLIYWVLRRPLAMIRQAVGW
jgi:hypothetical protein